MYTQGPGLYKILEVPHKHIQTHFLSPAHQNISRFCCGILFEKKKSDKYSLEEESDFPSLNRVTGDFWPLALLFH